VSLSQRPQSLAVHVRTQAGREAYIGWSGLSSARPTPGSSQREVLEVDPGLASSFGWAEGSLVRSCLAFSPIPSLAEPRLRYSFPTGPG
jgi:hypothetical protein